MTRRALLISLLLTALHASTIAAAPTASDAWIALGPPGNAPLAGYLTLHNPGPAAVALVGVGSPEFARIELHSTVQDGATMRMHRVPRLDLAVGGRIVLGPGRLHLMLFGPRRPLVAGERVALELAFDDGTTLTVEAEVRDPRATAAPHHQDGTH